MANTIHLNVGDDQENRSSEGLTPSPRQAITGFLFFSDSPQLVDLVFALGARSPNNIEPRFTFISLGLLK